jgi:acetylornithine deacetylase/succinyl-diaminopimelate desuccinylase-like protein
MVPNIATRVLKFAIEIQQIPAPTFNEGERAKFIQDRFRDENLEDISQDKVGNVYARLQGKSSSRPVVVSAHLDTVFPMETNLLVKHLADKIAGPGIGDNAVGLAGLFGLLWELRQRQVVLNSDLWLVANVGEEGLGDLRGMRALVDRFADKPRAYIVLEGMALGQVYHRGLGVRRYRITVKTPGGHSWVDYGRPSAVHEMAHIITLFDALDIPEQPRTTMNVGMIAGGTSVNTIAAEAYLELDLRSEDQSTINELVAKITGVLHDVQNPDIEVFSEMIGQRPMGEIPENHPLVMQAVPAIGIGITTGNGAHTINEFIHTPPVSQGIDQLLWIIEGVDRS